MFDLLMFNSFVFSLLMFNSFVFLGKTAPEGAVV